MFGVVDGQRALLEKFAADETIDGGWVADVKGAKFAQRSFAGNLRPGKNQVEDAATRGDGATVEQSFNPLPRCE